MFDLNKKTEFIHHFPSASIILDIELKIINVNALALDVFEMSKSDLIMKNILDLIEDKDSNIVLKILERAKETEVVFSKDIRLKSSPYVLKVNLKYNTSEKYYCLSFTNITSYIEAEQLHRSIIDNSEDVIMRFDKEHKHLYVNPVVESMTGIPAKNFINKSHEEIGFPEDLCVMWDNAINQVIDSGKSHRIEFSLPTGVYIDWLVIPEFNDSNEVETTIAFARVITEKKKQEEIIKKNNQDLSDKNEALKRLSAKYKASNKQLERFSSIVSHDLKTPIRNVSGFANLLKRSAKDRLTPKEVGFLDISIRTAQNMYDLVDDLLEYSRINAKTLVADKFNLDELLEKVLIDFKFQISETGATIQLNGLDKEIFADKFNLSQVFHNLIANSLKFTKEGIQPVISINCKEEEDKWHFNISDNGIGIEPKYFDQVFDIFNRLHSGEEYEGTGVGLATCKMVIEKHNGNIWIESEPEKGTTFFFDISKNIVM